MKKTIIGTYFSNYEKAVNFCDEKKEIIIFGSKDFAGFLVVSKKQLELCRKR